MATKAQLTDTKTKKEFEKVLDSLVKNEIPSQSESIDPMKRKADPLATSILEKYERVKTQRADLEEIWLDAKRQFRGVYSPEVLAKMHPKRSKANIRLTRTKVKTVDSRLSDFLEPANGERNWGIKPTPIAEFSENQINAIVEMVLQQTGQVPTPEEVQLIVQKSAVEKAEKMERVIEDQLASLRYRSIMKEVRHSGNLYGTGILKGPMMNIKSDYSYAMDSESGDWSMQRKDTLTPFIEAVSIWDIFPDLSATTIEDCNYIIQRHKMSKHKLLQLAKRSDFDNDVIYDYIKSAIDGDFEEQHYDIELQTLGGTYSTQESTKNSNKYEVLEFWGYLDANDLERVGADIPEDKKGATQLAACVWVIGNYVIKACLTPIEGVKWPYYFYYYDKDETSIFGEGIASIMKDVQELINASFRGMLDNAAISAGPQIEANLDLLGDDEDPTEIYPFKVWLRSGQGADATAPAINVHTMPSYTNNFIQMNEAFEKYGDEVTTIPRYMWGDNPGSGAGRTASGLSMMLGSANITIKDQVKNFDDGITKPFITAMYHWNMQFNPDSTIKGDYDIIAKGSSSLIAKEVYANSLMQFANIITNPNYAELAKPANVLKSIVDVLDLEEKDLIKTEPEIQAEQQRKAAEQQQLQQFMTQITEVAREYGVSPTDMLEQGQIMMNQLQQNQNARQAV